MAIPFTCPHCGKQASTADDLAGQRVACAGCGQVVTVPAPSLALGEDAAEATSAPRLRAFSDNPYVAPVEGPAEPPAGRGCGCGTIAVVVVLGLLLLGLLLPAVRTSRESARRVQCQNNLRNIALGLLNYHDTYKTFPIGAMHAGAAGDSARIGPSWWFGVLPYCEQRNIYEKIETLQQPGAPGNGAFNAQNVNAHIPGSPLNKLVPDFMRCPSSPLPLMEESTGPIVLPTYAGIAGGCDIAADSPDYQAAGGVPNLIPRATRNYYNRQKGVGHVPGGIITASGLLPACEQVGMAGCTDGTSNTMVVGEQSDWLRDVNRDSSSKYHGDPGWDAQGTGPLAASTTAGGGFLSGRPRPCPCRWPTPATQLVHRRCTTVTTSPRSGIRRNSKACSAIGTPRLQRGSRHQQPAAIGPSGRIAGGDGRWLGTVHFPDDGTRRVAAARHPRRRPDLEIGRIRVHGQ